MNRLSSFCLPPTNCSGPIPAHSSARPTNIARMRRHCWALACFLSAVTCYGDAPFAHSVIPRPHAVETRAGSFHLNPSTVIDSSLPSDDFAAPMLARILGVKVVAGGAIAKPSQTANSNRIHLAVNPAVAPEAEGYVLSVAPDGIVLTGHDAAGVFYGSQTLLQLLPADYRAGEAIELPAGEIRDNPRLPWRGMHLDVSRHFFPKERIFEFIDYLARYKFNVFHWHLSDDHGWRIEIKQRPRLTEVGAWREDTRNQKWDYRQHPVIAGRPVYGGFYTQDEIREIVRYATSQHITIVPEIDVPGHSWAALLAYPELSCSGKPFFTPTDTSFAFTDPVCAGNEETYTFLKEVFGEIMDLFPSEYIHLGGDEAKKTPWEHCPKCQAMITREGLHGVEGLQSYFIRRLGAFINSRGRKYIGWDEIREGGLPAGAAIMSWRGEQGGIDTARAGQHVVMAPGEYLYLNKYQQDPTVEDTSEGGVLTLRTVYEYEPVPGVLTPDEAKMILGVQGCLWSEHVQTWSRVQTQIFPRLLALSEVAWSDPRQKNYENFTRRLGANVQRLSAQGIDFFLGPPTGLDAKATFLSGTRARIQLGNPTGVGTIVTTLDHSTPTAKSAVWTGPLEITEPCTLASAVVLPNGKMSRVNFSEIRFLPPHAPAFHEAPMPLQRGIDYTYCEGKFTTLDIATWPAPLASGHLPTVSLIANRAIDHFAVTYSGFIKVQQDDIYTFALTSDDGSRLYVHDQRVVDNDGSHAATTASGSIALKAGYHPIRVEYFEDIGGQSLELMIRTNLSGAIDPASILFRTGTAGKN